MKFDWDPAKNRSNIRKHGFDFRDAEEMFGGALLVRPTLKRTTGRIAGLELE